MSKNVLRSTFLDTLPVMAGYVFLGMGFGILMQQNGFGFLWAMAMSLFVYAGSMQFVAVGLLSGGAGLVTTALTTLLVNARHLFYGLSMVKAYQGAGRKKPYLIFALTDETYSLVSVARPPEGVDRQSYCLMVSALDQLYWLAGTALGSLAGAWLPINFQGIDFALTALFVTIFVDQWLSAKDHFPAAAGVAATAVCLLIFGRDLFLIPSMVSIVLILSVARKGREENG